MNKCSVDGCDNTAWAKELCNKHYLRKAKHGDVNYTMTPTLGMTRKERIEHYTERRDGCLVWTGDLVGIGYGHMSHNNKNYRAHRVAYEEYVGEIPKGLCVLHKCDNPACVKPDHLFLGTNADNSADMTSKNRQAKGSAVGGSRLTQSDVLEIVALRKDGKSHAAIASIFGVAKGTIVHITQGNTWAWLTGT